MAWQPIETAPRDGAQILLYGFGTEKVMVGWWDGGNQPHPWKFLDWTNELNGAWEASPTHWMPLPTPPGTPEPAPVVLPDDYPKGCG